MTGVDSAIEVTQRQAYPPQTEFNSPEISLILFSVNSVQGVPVKLVQGMPCTDILPDIIRMLLNSVYLLRNNRYDIFVTYFT